MQIFSRLFSLSGAFFFILPNYHKERRSGSSKRKKIPLKRIWRSVGEKMKEHGRGNGGAWERKWRSIEEEMDA